MIFLAALFLSACGAGQADQRVADRPEVGLFTSLPIYWGESDNISAIIDGSGKPDWVRKLIERRFAMQPLDALEPDTLAGTKRLIMAQPRPLAPSENLALDQWVRDGGRLLVFADPMLTRHSNFAIGDKRRQQDVVVLSPILTRWGLELFFDDEQAEGERWVKAYDGEFPVNLSGQFRLRSAGEEGECIVSETGLLAQCQVGKGRVTLLADAAVLDWEGEGEVPAKRTGALDSLVAASLDY
ncbi:Gldg family protein [Qipengyuania soli]|uniref:ABC transporter n=1 Tax=Qipengyuania soli TaxID=2782568 RepID=A0A7S8F5I7_9SPHN|nr:DUF4350 domain-containing protein [Qipengyuania soli]QPC99388.1 ABC transporter [Qipengyuania soli]